MRCHSWPTGESVFVVRKENALRCEYLAYLSVTVSFYRQLGVNAMNNMSPEVALHRISPELRPLLCSVVRNGRVGLDSTNCLRVTDLKTGWEAVLGPLVLNVKQCSSSLLRPTDPDRSGWTYRTNELISHSWTEYLYTFMTHYGESVARNAFYMGWLCWVTSTFGTNNTNCL